VGLGSSGNSSTENGNEENKETARAARVAIGNTPAKNENGDNK
jgi:hypothetical protein